MKKLMVLLLAMALMSSFSACGENNEKTDGTNAITTTTLKTEDSLETELTSKNDDSEESEGSDDSFFNKENYTSEKGEPTVYTNSYYSVKTTYKLKEKADRTLPVEITLESVNVTLNSTKINELIKSGWTLINGNKADSNVEPSARTDSIVETTDGKKAYVWATNTTATAIEFSECLIRELNIRYDDKAVYYDGLTEATDFKYSGTISSASSLEDVISVLGEPDYIYTTESFEDEILRDTIVTISYEDSNDMTATFEFKNEGDSSKMIKVEISYK